MALPLLIIVFCLIHFKWFNQIRILTMKVIYKLKDKTWTTA